MYVGNFKDPHALVSSPQVIRDSGCCKSDLSHAVRGDFDGKSFIVLHITLQCCLGTMYDFTVITLHTILSSASLNVLANVHLCKI